MNEITTSLNISGVPVWVLPELDKIDSVKSRAVVKLILEALEARKKAAEKEGK